MGEAQEGEEEREMGEATERDGFCMEGKWECAGIVEAEEYPGCLPGSIPFLLEGQLVTDDADLLLFP